MESKKAIYNGLKSHYGAIQQLADRCNVSTRWVTLVLKGQCEDENLVLEASKLWLELEQAKKDKLDEAARNAALAQTIAMATV